MNQNIKKSTLKGIVCDLGDKAWKYKREINLKAKINPEGQFTRVKEIDVSKTLNTSKAAGIDNLPPKILKNAADELSAPRCSLINKSLKVSSFPTSEKYGKITRF